MKRILPMMLLGLMGCTVVGCSSASSPQGTTGNPTPTSTVSTSINPTSINPTATNPTASTQPTAASRPNQPESQPAQVPESVQPKKPETIQAEPPKSSDAQPPTPIDDPTERNARLEIARKMDDADTQVYRNPNWKLTIGGIQNWSGVNNTGDLTYEGCDANGKCLTLQGGKVSCSNGICAMGWQNGEYLYSLQSPMGESDRPTAPMSLKVFQGDRLILEETGFTATQIRSN